jgi:DNA-directed RNA polymerase specialized sigma24 family protein
VPHNEETNVQLADEMATRAVTAAVRKKWVLPFDVEDAKQEARIAVLEALKVHGEQGLRGLFYMAAAREVTDFVRRTYRQGRGKEFPKPADLMLAGEHDPERTWSEPVVADHADAVAEQVDAERKVSAIFESDVLTDGQKMLLKVLFACNGDRIQAAVELRMSDGAFRKNLERIRERLRDSGLGEAA